MENIFKGGSYAEKIFYTAGCFLLSVMVGGCVSSSKFEKKVAEADGLNQALQALQPEVR